eukprot:1096474-Alexandrium_andersonii.AAC.1
MNAPLRSIGDCWHSCSIPLLLAGWRTSTRALVELASLKEQASEHAGVARAGGGMTLRAGRALASMALGGR